MEPKSKSNKKREQIISTILILVLLTIATLAPCIIMYMFATIGK
jgi:flagellar basal body-associated protein FliL